ncbi:hypothetical protein LINGRAPRIM_LOCUS2719 [Linum grandiflorum]
MGHSRQGPMAKRGPSGISYSGPAQTVSRPHTTFSPMQLPICQHCRPRHPGVCRRLTNGCFRCGDQGHRVSNCPLMTGQAESEVSVHQSNRARSGSGFSGGRSGSYQRGGCFQGGRVGSRSQISGARQTGGQTQGRVYAMTHEEAETATDAVTGTLSILGRALYALFDTGSTHSFISRRFALTLKVIPEDLGYHFGVRTPVGKTVVVKSIIRNVFLNMEGAHLQANLMLLPFDEFYVIIGMDWLTQHGAVLDCRKKEVKINTSENGKIVFKSIQREQRERTPLLSVVQAFKLIREGCEAYLVHVTMEKTEKMEDVDVVKKFTDVFPEEFPGLPREREVEFDIELVPGTAPISIAPYRMAPIELVELKKKLQELLDKGFIRPSVSA